MARRRQTPALEIREVLVLLRRQETRHWNPAFAGIRLFRHPERGTEARLRRPLNHEPAALIEPARRWIGDDHQRVPVAPCLVSGGVNQCPADPARPGRRLDKQTVELSESVMRLDNREPHDMPADFRDRHIAALDESEREIDRIGMRFQVRPVGRIGQRGPSLQILQRLPFNRERRTKTNLSAP